MSNAFCLPITLNSLPNKWLNLAIVALHCVPLPAVLWTTNTVNGWLLGGVVVGSLCWELRKQRMAKAATRLVATTTNEWVLYRGSAHYAKAELVELVEQMDCGYFVLLLMTQHRRKFRLVIPAKTQANEQLHRLRLRLLNIG